MNDLQAQAEKFSEESMRQAMIAMDTQKQQLDAKKKELTIALAKEDSTACAELQRSIIDLEAQQPAFADGASRCGSRAQDALRLQVEDVTQKLNVALEKKDYEACAKLQHEIEALQADAGELVDQTGRQSPTAKAESSEDAMRQAQKKQMDAKKKELAIALEKQDYTACAELKRSITDLEAQQRAFADAATRCGSPAQDALRLRVENLTEKLNGALEKKDYEASAMLHREIKALQAETGELAGQAGCQAASAHASMRSRVCELTEAARKRDGVQ